jgi:AraC-like DNA-binding protein
MNLDRLLENMGLTVRPFALCHIHRGWRLALAESNDVHVHLVIQGSGTLKAANHFSTSICPLSLIIVPTKLGHKFEPLGKVSQELAPEAATCRLFAPDIDELSVGDGEGKLTLMCGKVHATYGGLTGLFEHLREPLVADMQGNASAVAVFESMFKEQSAVLPGQGRMLRLLMEQCLIHLFRQLCGEPRCNLPWLGALQDPRLGKAFDAMLTEPGKPHSLETLAASAGMSRSAFAEHFKATFSRPPMDFLRETRLRRGAHLLRNTDLPIKVIADRIGFASRSHFSTAFKQLFSTEPARFRDG